MNMKKILLFIILLIPICIFTQQREVFRIDSLPKTGILLNQGWKWHTGDNPGWAKPEFDDARWEDIDPSKDIVQLTNISTDQPLWLRIKLNPRAAKNYALSISQSGAAEIYLNGRLIQKIGQIDPSNQHSKAYNPLDDHLILRLDSLDNTLAVRYYFQQGLNLDPIYNIRYPFFSARIFDSKYIITSHKSYFWPGFNIGFAFILFFIHGVLFLYYPPLRANFWLSAWAFLNTLFSYFLFQLDINPYLERNAQYVFFALLMSLFGSFCLLYCLYLLLEIKRKIYVYLFVALILATIIIYYLCGYATRDMLWFVITIFQTLLTVSMAIDANRQRSRSGMPVLYGTLAYFLFWTLFITSYELSWSPIYKDILFHLATLSFPVTMSALLGFKFRQVNQSMLHNLEQVNQLYAEKQQILSSQNETLERQVTERTAEISEKNRELLVEASLDRVRARALSMQQSKEVMDVADTLYEELQNLDFKYGASTIMIMHDESSSMEHWVAGFDHLKYPESYHVNYFKNPCYDAQFEAWRNGQKYLVYTLAGDEKKAYDEQMFEHNDYQKFPTKEQQWMRAGESVIFSLAFMKHGALHWGPTPLSEEKAQILQRFAAVFEQAYTRFLDLQKAEAQAREAEIELSLERVRTKTMAMQHSNQLREIAATTLEQLQSLGFTYGACSIVIMDAVTGDMIWWISGFEKDYPASYHIPYFDHPFYLEQLNHWKEGEKYAVMVCEGEAKKSYDKVIFSKTEFVKIPDELQKIMQAFEKITFSNAYMQQGALSWSTDPLEDEHAKILQRFAAVFEQSYTRFLDLQKAEAQAREAQIEVALERVRSRSISMTTTEEIGNIIFTLFSELRKLDLALDRSFIITFDADLQGMVYWMAGPEGLLSQNGFHIPMFDHPFNHALIDNYKKKTEKWEFLLEGKTKKTWDDIAFVDSDLSQLPDFIKDSMINYGDVSFSLSSMGYGTMLVSGREQVNAAQFDLILRFSRVFEQTYTRFLDLKHAEAQAREAQIEVALERVRARAMSMQTSEEINAVIGKIFTECKSLEIQLDASVIIIYDKQTNDTAWYLTNHQDPDYPARFRVPNNEYTFYTAMLNAWHQKTIDWDYMLDVQEKKEWDKFVFSKTDFVLLPDNIKEVMAAVEKLYIKASFNEFGCLMLTSLTPLNNEQMSILPRFSKVFELTYTRFNDLKIAEAQAEQAKLDLIQIQTEKKKAEDTLVKLRSTQAQLIQSEKLASLGELTAGIAHEIQNPLNFVNNFSELSVELAEELKEEINKPELDKGLIEELAADLATNQEKINHHGKRASSIVKGMLEHSRMGDAMNRVSTNLNALADEYLRLAYHGLRAKDSSFNATLETHFDPDLPLVSVIPQDIGRVLLNLINNAFYAVAERSRSTVNEKAKQGLEGYSPTVTISTQKLENTIEIRVKDNGNGIPETIKDKIFQPFFTTKPTGQGTGLGLSLAYDIVTKGHGGRLTVKSLAGQGTTFTVRLQSAE
jgi:signal transduction histidine kinase